MDIRFLNDKIEEIAKNSESEEVRLLALIMQVKSEFDSGNMTELKEMHKKQLQILENHTKILDKLTDRIAEQDQRITHNESEISKLRVDFESWRDKITKHFSNAEKIDDNIDDEHLVNEA